MNRDDRRAKLMETMAVAAESRSTQDVLEWFQLSRFARDYELRSESGVVQAKLNFSGFFTTHAVAEAAGHQWALHLEGIWRQRVIATRRGEHEPELVMTMAPLGWAGRGTVKLRDGQTYQWGPRTLLHDRV